VDPTQFLIQSPLLVGVKVVEMVGLLVGLGAALETMAEVHTLVGPEQQGREIGGAIVLLLVVPLTLLGAVAVVQVLQV